MAISEVEFDSRLGIVCDLYCVGEFMKKVIMVLIFAVFIVGCTRIVEVDRNITIEKIVYQNVTTIVKEECNTTFNDVFDISQSREIELIRRIRFLENEQDDCILQEDKCEENCTEFKEDLEMVERDLDDCEEELCEEYNDSGWC